MSLGDYIVAEEHAHATQRLAAIGEMTGGIAHDFRNLLAAIESGLALAEKNWERPEKAVTYIAGARKGIDRGLKLTSQLLSFAKQQKIDARAEDVNQLLKALELFLRYSAGPRVRIAFGLGTDIPKCLINSTQFDAAVLNLVVNARDAMPDGGDIQITTGLRHIRASTAGLPAPGSYVRVRVKDSGDGIPDDVMKRMLDPFFTTKGDKGTGLGLPQVSAFMRRIGGHVILSSESGSGTTVDLLFPSPGPGAALTSSAFACDHADSGNDMRQPPARAVAVNRRLAATT